MTRPAVLVTNDDGVRAPGLAALARALERDLGAEVTVVAPDREQSGASHAMTIRSPLRFERVAESWYSVEGTPTDCVNLAIFHLLDERPALVVSGINAGYNLGEDVTYSGTVAGALEARILGIASVAVSSAPDASAEDLDAVAAIAARVAAEVLARGLPADSLLNVNVPPAPRGIRLTHQGRRAFREGLIERRDPKGREYYWIGLAPSEWEPDDGADHAAIAERYVSVTPLHSDMTCHRAIPVLSAWGLERLVPGSSR